MTFKTMEALKKVYNVGDLSYRNHPQYSELVGTKGTTRADYEFLEKDHPEKILRGESLLGQHPNFAGKLPKGAYFYSSKEDSLPQGTFASQPDSKGEKRVSDVVKKSLKPMLKSVKSLKPHMERIGVREYRDLFSNYQFEIKWSNEEDKDVEFNLVDVLLKTTDKVVHTSNFITRKYLDYLFEKNERTGENVGGIYFAMPYLVIVSDLRQHTVKSTIDDMVDGFSVQIYFDNF